MTDELKIALELLVLLVSGAGTVILVLLRRTVTGCVTLEAANKEFQRFERDPGAFVSRLGRSPLAPRNPRASPRSRSRPGPLRVRYGGRMGSPEVVRGQRGRV